MKDRDTTIATAVAGLGVAALVGKTCRHLIDKEDNFLMKLGVIVGGSVVGLMGAEKAMAWARAKVEEQKAEEVDPTEKEDA